MDAIIVGGGIGGLAAALSLHAVGIEVDVFERARAIRELGVGINLLPHAVRELAALGMLPRLDEVGLRTHELIYQNRFGQTVWRELRGCDAGHEFPQFSIHRGRLQSVLCEAVLERLGPSRVHCGHEFVSHSTDGSGVSARFALRDGGDIEVAGDLLIGADGIHSALRRQFYPQEGPPRWNGMMLWRGATEWPAFLTGRSMVIAGGMDAKVVLYPIAPAVPAPTARCSTGPSWPGSATALSRPLDARTGAGRACCMN